MSLTEILSNKNIKLLNLLIVIVGLILILVNGLIVDRLILEANKDWNKTLKFNSENAIEFQYAVETQQGRLNAEGDILPISDLLIDDRLDGQFMAVQEVFEEYREHTKYYSCNCRTIGDSTECDTCSETYWTWDIVGADYRKIDKISLLGQELNGNMIPWDIGHYVGIKLKNGDYHYYYNPWRRSVFYVVNDSNGRWGFISDENGFRYESNLNGPKSETTYIIAKWVINVIIISLTIGGIYWNMTTNIELGVDHYV